MTGLFHNLWVEGQNCQIRAAFLRLSKMHTLKNPLASRLTGDGEDRGAFRPGRSHGHRSFSKLRPGDPCYGNGKGRYMEMDYVTEHNKGVRHKAQGVRNKGVRLKAQGVRDKGVVIATFVCCFWLG